MARNTPPSRETEVQRLRRLAHVLDEAVRLPGGYRIGLDGIVGAVPGVGDSLGAVVSVYIVTAAARLGVPTVYLLRMILNIGLDMLVGLIPVLGDLFDFVWKANTRNLALLEKGLGRASRGKKGEQRLIFLIVILAALVIATVFTLSMWVLAALVSLIRG